MLLLDTQSLWVSLCSGVWTQEFLAKGKNREAVIYLLKDTQGVCRAMWEGVGRGKGIKKVLAPQ